MKRRTLSALLALCLMLSFLPATVQAENGDFTIENGVLTQYTGSGGTVTIPDGVTAIGARAFENCVSLTSVTLPAGVGSIGDYALYACTLLASVTLPNGVTEIGMSAFEGCFSLESVAIPASVESIGICAFAACLEMSAITVDAANPSYASRDGVLFNKDKTTLIQCPGGMTGGCTVPASVTSIGDYAFIQCELLTSVTLPAGVESIGDYAFHYCDALTDVYYSGTETQWQSITIGSNNEPLTGATIHYVPALSGRLDGTLLTYTVTNAPEGAMLAAARYDGGRMTFVTTIGASGNKSDTITMGGSGTTYRLMLVDANYAPLCPAWDNGQ